MKDSVQQENETTTKKDNKLKNPIKNLLKKATKNKASRLEDTITAVQERIVLFEDHWIVRIGKLEARMREFTDCCSEVLTRLTDQGLIISEFRKNSTMLLEVTDFNRKELDHLRQSTLELVKHVGNIEDKFKGELEIKNEDLMECLNTDRMREDLQQDMRNCEYRIEQKTLSSIMRYDNMIGELSKALYEQGSLINNRIDRLYHELQVLNDSYKLNHLSIKQAVDCLGNAVNELNDARGLDLDMKKIVDGLEETVHGLESKLGLRCDLHERTVARFKERAECDIFNHIFVFRNEMEEIKKTRKLTEWLVVLGFTMALVAFVFTVTNLIKQIFF